MFYEIESHKNSFFLCPYQHHYLDKGCRKSDEYDDFSEKGYRLTEMKVETPKIKKFYL